MLLNQIRSHFFYHTLNALQALIVLKPEAAYKMAGDFARYLRFTLTPSLPTAGSAFREEIRAVRAYADINQQQLGTGCTWSTRSRTWTFPSPLLTIQPIVENAILHGIKPKVGGGNRLFEAEELPDHWQVTVTDDGVGFAWKLSERRAHRAGECAAAHSLLPRQRARSPAQGMGTQAVLTYGKRGKTWKIFQNRPESVRFPYAPSGTIET